LPPRPHPDSGRLQRVRRQHLQAYSQQRLLHRLHAALDLATGLHQLRRLRLPPQLPQARWQRHLRPRVRRWLRGGRRELGRLRRLPPWLLQDFRRRPRLHAVPAERVLAPREPDLNLLLHVPARLHLERRHQALRRLPARDLQQQGQREQVLCLRQFNCNIIIDCVHGPRASAGRLPSYIVRCKPRVLPRQHLQQRLGKGLHGVPVASDVLASHRPHKRLAVRVQAGPRASRHWRVHRVRAR
jgi:hypothetical protein